MNIIKRLRRKFIIMATIGVIVVLGGALGLINTIAYMRMHQQVMSVLTYIIHNDGAVPQKSAAMTAVFSATRHGRKKRRNSPIRYAFSASSSIPMAMRSISISSISPRFLKRKPLSTPGRPLPKPGKVGRIRDSSRKGGPVMPI